MLNFLSAETRWLRGQLGAVECEKESLMAQVAALSAENAELCARLEKVEQMRLENNVILDHSRSDSDMKTTKVEQGDCEKPLGEIG